MSQYLDELKLKIKQDRIYEDSLDILLDGIEESVSITEIRDLYTTRIKNLKAIICLQSGEIDNLQNKLKEQKSEEIE
jgi:hypothetical protein